MKLKKGEWFIVLFNIAYILAFAIYYLSIGNFEFMIYIGVLVVIATIILLTLKKSHLDYLALWGLSIWGLLHMMGGGLIINGKTLYKLHLINIIDNGGDFFILKMDQAIHFYGFAIAAIIVFQLVAPHLKNQKKLGLIIFIAWLGGMGFGALNEVIEFSAFLFVPETGVGDLYNTGLDLIFNLFGSLLGAFVGAWWHKKKLANNKA